MKGKHPDTAVGGGISRNYAFMNEIIIANIEGMIHGGLFIFTGEMNFIHKINHEVF